MSSYTTVLFSVSFVVIDCSDFDRYSGGEFPKQLQYYQFCCKCLLFIVMTEVT
jgi:hypothetical protein